jgi:hypothetical protein
MRRGGGARGPRRPCAEGEELEAAAEEEARLRALLCETFPHYVKLFAQI